MSAEELLAKADEVLEEKGWGVGRLCDPSTGAHCALGSIGYAKWGEDFDRAALIQRYDDTMNQGNGIGAYRMLAEDPEGREAMHVLAQEIRAKSLINENDARGLSLPETIPLQVRRDASLIALYNDKSTRDEAGRVQRMFKGFKLRWQDRLKAMLPKKQEIEVEHVAAPVARPIRTADLEHAEGVEVHE